MIRVFFWKLYQTFQTNEGSKILYTNQAVTSCLVGISTINNGIRVRMPCSPTYTIGGFSTYYYCVVSFALNFLFNFYNFYFAQTLCKKYGTNENGGWAYGCAQSCTCGYYTLNGAATLVNSLLCCSSSNCNINSNSSTYSSSCKFVSPNSTITTPSTLTKTTSPSVSTTSITASTT